MQYVQLCNMYNYSKNILLLNPYVVTLRKILLDVLKLFPEYPNEQEWDNQNSIYLLFFISTATFSFGHLHTLATKENTEI